MKGCPTCASSNGAMNANQLLVQKENANDYFGKSMMAVKNKIDVVISNFLPPGFLLLDQEK